MIPIPFFRLSLKNNWKMTEKSFDTGLSEAIRPVSGKS
jgi:hypothetical protein